MHVITGSGLEHDDVISQVDKPVLSIFNFKGGFAEN